MGCVSALKYTVNVQIFIPSGGEGEGYERSKDLTVERFCKAKYWKLFECKIGTFAHFLQN